MKRLKSHYYSFKFQISPAVNHPRLPIKGRDDALKELLVMILAVRLCTFFSLSSRVSPQQPHIEHQFRKCGQIYISCAVSNGIYGLVYFSMPNALEILPMVKLACSLHF